MTTTTIQRLRLRPSFFLFISLLLLLSIPAYNTVYASSDSPNTNTHTNTHSKHHESSTNNILTPSRKFHSHASSSSDTDDPELGRLSKFRGDTVCDTTCQYATLDQLNTDLRPLIKNLTQTVFFRYFKVNLHKDCPFWPENPLCIQKDCAVSEAEEDEIPDEWKTSTLSSVDFSPGGLGVELPLFKKECDEADFCILDDENAAGGTFVNLLSNPERFTGYAGESSRRIWKSIYEENCFQMAGGSGGSSSTSGNTESSLEPAMDTCLEKRVFYRVLSGLHTSISVHICDEYLDRKTGEWKADLNCYIYRIGQFPDRIKNVYFAYAILLRAMDKATPFLRKYKFCTGAKGEDERIGKLIRKLTRRVVAYPRIFDETALFRDHVHEYFPPAGDSASSTTTTTTTPVHRAHDGEILKEEFKRHFRNVSLIMDCVACEKCRLWGKLQVQGLGTALKILFSFENENVKLSRTELVAFFNTFNRFSETIEAIERFEQSWVESGGSGSGSNSEKEKEKEKDKVLSMSDAWLFVNEVYAFLNGTPRDRLLQFVVGLFLIVTGVVGIVRRMVFERRSRKNVKKSSKKTN